MLATGPVRRMVLPAALAETFDLFQKLRWKVFAELAERGMAGDVLFEVFVGGTVRKARADEIAVGEAKGLGQATSTG